LQERGAAAPGAVGGRASALRRCRYELTVQQIYRGWAHQSAREPGEAAAAAVGIRSRGCGDLVARGTHRTDALIARESPLMPGPGADR
jgi:hypothetical protein